MRRCASDGTASSDCKAVSGKVILLGANGKFACALWPTAAFIPHFLHGGPIGEKGVFRNGSVAFRTCSNKKKEAVQC